MKHYEFFKKYIPDLKPDVEQQKVLCPFHDDTNASLSINLEKGVYFCHGCDKKGDIYKWYMEQHNCSFKEAKKAIIGDLRIPVLSEGEAEEAHKILLNKDHLLKAIKYRRGWTVKTIKKFGLGWNERESRVYIPIRNESDELINIRKYDLYHKDPKFKFYGIKGHNSPYIFPIKNLIDNETVMLMAGEPDTILACQLGMVAVTFTGGEGAFAKQLLPMFKDKIVYICYDCDKAGGKGSKYVASEIINHAKEVKIITLPF